MSFNRLQRKEIKPEQALIRLEELCARSEQCTGELRRKLRLWRIADDDADTILRSLQRRRFVDDARFARSYVRDKYRFGRWGRRKIEMGLRQKRVPDNLIEEALDEIDPKEYAQILMHILRAKSKPLERPVAYEDRLKLFRFALSRGYESELVRKALAIILK